MSESAIFGVLAFGVLTIVMCVSMIALIISRGRHDRIVRRHLEVLHKGIEEMKGGGDAQAGE